MPKEVRITIILKPDGSVGLEAPIEDKILCYGMLKYAEELILKHEPDENAILIPPPGLKVG